MPVQVIPTTTIAAMSPGDRLGVGNWHVVFTVPTGDREVFVQVSQIPQYLERGFTDPEGALTLEKFAAFGHPSIDEAKSRREPTILLRTPDPVMRLVPVPIDRVEVYVEQWGYSFPPVPGGAEEEDEIEELDLPPLPPRQSESPMPTRDTRPVLVEPTPPAVPRTTVEVDEKPKAAALKPEVVETKAEAKADAKKTRRNDEPDTHSTRSSR